MSVDKIENLIKINIKDDVAEKTEHECLLNSLITNENRKFSF